MPSPTLLTFGCWSARTRWLIAMVWLVSIYSGAQSQAVDNGVLGTPRVTCEESRLLLDVETKQPFFGHIFVKGKYKDDQCTKRFNDSSRRGAYFMVPLGRCGMQRLRSASPRGMSFVITVIVSFHPLFITKTDRAYHVRCFYVEPDELVSSHLEVSVLPTTILQDSMAMPSCTYTVRLESPDGKTATFANVGDRVFHVWDCKGPDMGILVKKCYVNNGESQEVAVVDNEGCSTDLNLLGDLIYDQSLMKAYAPSQVFKYADQNTLFFACQIRMCQKKLGMCEGVTPPKCASTADPVKALRLRRAIDLERLVRLSDNVSSPIDRTIGSAMDEVDVITEEIMVLDLDRRVTEKIDPSNTSTESERRRGDACFDASIDGSSTEGLLCLSTPMVSAFVGMSIFMVVLAAAISGFVFRTAAVGRSKLGQFLAPSIDSDLFRIPPPSRDELSIKA